MTNIFILAHFEREYLGINFNEGVVSQLPVLSQHCPQKNQIDLVLLVLLVNRFDSSALNYQGATKYDKIRNIINAAIAK